MKTPKRCPVFYEQYLMNSIGLCWANINNKNIRFQMNILAEMLQEESDRKSGRRIKKKNKEMEAPRTENDDLRKFIALFRDRYAHETDMEYKSKFDPDEIGMMKGIIKKLTEKEVDIDEYLGWIFDDFFEDENNRKKFTPSVKLVCGTFVASKFFMNNRDRIRQRKTHIEEKSQRDSIRQHAKILYRRTKDSKIQKWLDWEKDDTISTEELEEYLINYEKENEVKNEE